MPAPAISLRNLVRAAALALGAASAVAVTGASAQQAGRPPAAVTVVTLKQASVTLTSALPGRVAASAVAEVRPQVNGIVTERLFKEGSPVQEGQPLYRIDDATYQAQVAAAEASVAQARAQLRQAQSEADRQKTLMGRSVVSQQNLDDALVARDVAAAAVQVAEANLRKAKIDLDHTTIRAQLSGTIGLSQTTKGALVTSGQATALAVIRTLDPVYVDVTQSAADLVRWRRNLAAGTAGAGDMATAPVTLKLADGTVYAEKGHLSAAEPHVDELTGVVVLRLEFPNPDGLLLPGMYVQVEMPQGRAENVVLVPQEAVSRDRRGEPVAMVVTAENKVEQRQLHVLRDSGANWVVDAGVKPGDRVIVAGLQKIAPGATVKPEERKAADTTGAAAPSGN
ncbi:efflux RND transporter periplasmic adaptor subunit [Acidimangrovimonas pyrenivorans]|uniref:Efflux RND transporter periplasmic adaptor subunit n=1 Tax=Acidimangrovimonas pyrenivorans TaxID=2030798 RepID=A0ABV7ACP6_9RHOB